MSETVETPEKSFQLPASLGESEQLAVTGHAGASFQGLVCVSMTMETGEEWRLR